MVVSNPFGSPTKGNKNSIKRYLAILTKELGLYVAYNSDSLVKAYRYCKGELGDDFDHYIKMVKKHIRRQEADYQSGKVSIQYLNDVFTKFPKIIEQLKREHKWSDNDIPDGWGIGEDGEPYSAEGYRLVSVSNRGYLFIKENSILLVSYNKDKKCYRRIVNDDSGEVLWEA